MPIESLPDDILLLIFEKNTPSLPASREDFNRAFRSKFDVKEHPHPLNIVKVCRPWRSIALSNANLWSKCSVAMYSPDENSLHSIDTFIQILVNRSGARNPDVPISFDIRLDNVAKQSKQLEKIFGRVLQQQHRWEDVRIIITPLIGLADDAERRETIVSSTIFEVRPPLRIKSLYLDIPWKWNLHPPILENSRGTNPTAELPATPGPSPSQTVVEERCVFASLENLSMDMDKLRLAGSVEGSVISRVELSNLRRLSLFSASNTNSWACPKVLNAFAAPCLQELSCFVVPQSIPIVADLLQRNRSSLVYLDYGGSVPGLEMLLTNVPTPDLMTLKLKIGMMTKTVTEELLALLSTRDGGSFRVVPHLKNLILCRLMGSAKLYQTLIMERWRAPNRSLTSVQLSRCVELTESLRRGGLSCHSLFVLPKAWDFVQDCISEGLLVTFDVRDE